MSARTSCQIGIQRTAQPEATRCLLGTTISKCLEQIIVIYCVLTMDTDLARVCRGVTSTGIRNGMPQNPIAKNVLNRLFQRQQLNVYMV